MGPKTRTKKQKKTNDPLPVEHAEAPSTERTPPNSSDEDTVHPNMGHQGATRIMRRSKGKQIATVQEPPPPTRADVEIARNKQAFVDRKYAALDKCKWEETRLPTKAVLRKIGLLGPVEEILEHMYMDRLLDRSYATHKEVSCQFLSSLSVVHYNNSKNPKAGWGEISFKVHGKEYHMTFSEIEKLFGFIDKPEHELPQVKDVAKEMWKIIGSGPWKPGTSKSNDIRHPALRLVQRILGQTFFARKENSKVKEGELQFMAMGINSIAQRGTTRSKFKMGTYNKVGVAGFFVDRLVEIAQNALTSKANKPMVRVGGLITAMLEFKKIDLGEITAPAATFDEEYMLKVDFIAGWLGNKVGYEMKIDELTAINREEGDELPEEDFKDTAYILLPHPFVKTGTLEDLEFAVPTRLLHDPEVAPFITHPPGTKAKRSTTSEASSSNATNIEDQEEERPESPIYGSARYSFKKYKDKGMSGHTKEAHKRIWTLKKLCKYQDRTIHKMLGKMKKMSSQIKAMSSQIKRLVRGSSSQSSRQAQADEHMEEAPEQGESSMAIVLRDVRRCPPHTKKPRRRIRMRTPSPPSSDNPSPDVSSEDDEDDDGFHPYDPADYV